MLNHHEMTADKPSFRCAIYTRKSREEGLQQAFNSLDAQRLASEQYIASQRHEGWVLLPEHYDDGGFSGGNMERPALKRLFTDIQENTVDCIVVYKIDRLTRSLLDFASIIALLDAHQVSFVSITESFNTANSMGRLMLNILLSFAQYERELSAERVRDKVAASKKLGIWMGGTIPLGYDVQDRKLVINEDEAKTIRFIYERYLETNSISTIVQELNTKGITSKSWISTKTGNQCGGKSFRTNSIRRILTNPTYTGKVTHKGNTYNGQQEAIIDGETFEKVKKIFKQSNKPKAIGYRVTTPPLLKGLLRCGECHCAMIPSYTNKKNLRYRYYICEHKHNGKNDECVVGRVPASEIESVVVAEVLNVLKSPEIISKTIASAKAETSLSEFEVINALQSIESIWDELFPLEQTRIITLLIQSVTIKTTGAYLKLYKDALHTLANELQEQPHGKDN